MMSKYEIILYWNDDDKSFIAEVPELPGCMADGETYVKALKKGKYHEKNHNHCADYFCVYGWFIWGLLAWEAIWGTITFTRNRGSGRTNCYANIC